MKSLIQILIFLLLFLHAEEKTKYNSSSAIIDSIEANIDSSPNSALKMGINYLKNYQVETPDSIVAIIHLKVASILNKQGLPVQALEYYVKALNYYIQAGRVSETGWFYNDLGNIYFKQKMYDKAEKKFKTARNIFIETGVLYAEATTVNNLALIAMERGDHKKALSLFYEALAIRTTFGKEPYLIAHSYKYLGDLFLKDGNIKKAMEYFQKIIDIGVTEGKGNIKGLSLQSIGEIYYMKNEINLAKNYYLSAEKSFIDDYNPKYLVGLYLKFAKLYIDEGQADSSSVFLHKALPHAKQHGLIDFRISILNQLTVIDEGNSPFTSLIPLFREIDSLKQIRYEMELIQSFERSEIQIELFDYKKKIIEKEYSLKIAKNHRALSITAIAFLFILLWFLYRQYEHNKLKALHRESIIKHKLNIELLTSEKRQNEIESKKKELLSKATFIQQKNDVIEKFIKDLKYHIGLLENKGDRQHFKHLIESLGNLQSSEKNWNEFEKHFGEIYPQLLQKLTSHFDTLTSTDLKMCTYLIMNMNTKDISKLTGLTIRAIEVRRHRLRKKLNIPKGQNISAFLIAFSDTYVSHRA